MKTKCLLLVAACTAYLCLRASPAKDSLQKAKTSLQFAMYSTGIFPFAGSITNTHLNGNATFTYASKPCSFFVFKSFDLQSSETCLNYITTGFYKNFTLNSRLAISAFICYNISQQGRLIDPTSDALLFATISYTIRKGLQIENTPLFANITKKSLDRQLVDRLKILYYTGRFCMGVAAWYNAPICNNAPYFSVSPQVTYTGLRTGKHVGLVASLGLFRCFENNEAGAVRSDVVVNIAIPVKM